MYVNTFFYYKKHIFQCHFLAFFTYLYWQILHAKYGFSIFMGEEK